MVKRFQGFSLGAKDPLTYCHLWGKSGLKKKRDGQAKSLSVPKSSTSMGLILTFS
jgi:hypothetical protein